MHPIDLNSCFSIRTFQVYFFQRRVFAMFCCLATPQQQMYTTSACRIEIIVSKLVLYSNTERKHQETPNIKNCLMINLKAILFITNYQEDI